MKKALSIFIAMIIALSGMTVSFASEASGTVFNTDTRIEAEDGVAHLTGNEILVKSNDANAVGSYLLTNLATTRNVPEGDGDELYADYTYDVTIPSEATYYVYLRYRNNNSYWQGTYVTIDNNAYANYSGWQKGYSDWTWIQTASATLTAGVHTVKITARKGNNFIDSLCVTTNPDFTGEFPEPEVETETVVIEAEHTNFTPTVASKALYINGGGSAQYSNGYYVQNTGYDTEVKTAYTPETQKDIGYDVNVKTAGDYDVWVYYSGTMKASVHIAANNNNYPDAYGITLPVTSGWGWMKIKTLSLNAGDNKIGLILRNPGPNMDMFVVTNDPNFDGSSVTPAPVVTPLTNSTGLLEAENYAKNGIIDDAGALGGKTVTASSMDITFTSQRVFNETIKFWVRYKGNPAGMTVTADGKAQDVSEFVSSDKYVWKKVTIPVLPAKVTTVTLSGTDNMKIDAVIGYQYSTDPNTVAEYNPVEVIPQTVVFEAERTPYLPAKEGKVAYIMADASCSNGYYIATAQPYNTEDMYRESTPETVYDFRYDVNVEEAGNYDVWARYKQSLSESLSLHIASNDNKYVDAYGISLPKVTEWTWVKIKAVALNAGDNKIGIIYRKPGMNIDMFAVTNDTAFDGSEVELASALATEEANMKFIEAEELAKDGAFSEAAALGGKAVKAESLSFNFVSEKNFNRTARIWVRYKGNPEGIKITADGIDADVSSFVASDDYIWKKATVSTLPVKEIPVVISGIDKMYVDAVMVYYYSDQDPTLIPDLTTTVESDSFVAVNGPVKMFDTEEGKKLVAKYAIVSGKINKVEGPDVTSYGVVLSESESFEDAGVYNAEESKNGAFGVMLYGNGLTGKTFYAKSFVRCIDKNGNEYTIYGNVETIEF